MADSVEIRQGILSLSVLKESAKSVSLYSPNKQNNFSQNRYARKRMILICTSSALMLGPCSFLSNKLKISNHEGFLK
jgi:hypothetical protein